MDLSFKRTYVVIDTAFPANDATPEAALRKVAVVAIIDNPYAGRYVEDLKPLIDISPSIGRKMGEMLVQALHPYKAQSYGKAGVVGLHGEQEHAAALLTTAFAEPIREAIGGGKAWISSMVKVAAPGTPIDVPMAHKDALYVRSHYDGMTLAIPEGPMPGEIALIFCAATRGRLNARVGGLQAAMVEGTDGLV